MIYFKIDISQTATARFRRDWLGRLYIFQANCTNDNTWNGPGYGYGRWTRVSALLAKLGEGA